jgi:hypothetical protein
MTRKAVATRRQLLLSAGAAAALLPVNFAGVTADWQLVAIGREFDLVSSQLDYRIEQRAELPDDLFERLGTLLAGLEQVQATTMDGLFVKARAACWDLRGDFTVSDNSSFSERMSLAIIRDLIRAYQPDLERPGALARLLS